MATLDDFKLLAERRLKLVDILITNREWGMAAYMMGFVLECVLKAASCKALNLTTYPEPGITKNQQIINYFRTHSFEMLRTISGTSDIFDLVGEGSSSWSGFTQEYGGSWTNIRYEILEQFDEKKIKGLYRYLTEPPNGIIPIIDRKKRW